MTTYEKFSDLLRTFNEMKRTAGRQGAASSKEVKERRSALKTQGRKGAKAIRINMAFTPENHIFIKAFASGAGWTMTEACNLMLDYARTDREFVEIVLNRLESLKNDIGGFKPDYDNDEEHTE